MRIEPGCPERNCYNCISLEGDMCRAISHFIENGYAARHHARKCKWFRPKGGGDG